MKSRANRGLATLALLLTLFGFNEIIARGDTLHPKKVFLAVPVVLKSPEMGYGFGVSGSVTFKTSFPTDTLTRTSLIQAIGFFTTRKQNVQALDMTIFSPRERRIYLASLAHSYFPDRFWGIGPRTRDKAMEGYQYEQAFFTFHVKHRLFPHFYLGTLYEAQKLIDVNYARESLMAESDIKGKGPYFVSSLGGSVTYDTRKGVFWPVHGFYLYQQCNVLNGVFGSDFNMLKSITDLRFFKTTFRGQVIAAQFYLYQTFGQVPLRELASLGGSNNLRGFYQGRYRDHSMCTFITEYRVPVYKRVAMCLFGGGGEVFDEVGHFSFRRIKTAFGAGLRFALLTRERLNIRIDFGFANRHNFGSYVTVGECF